MLRSSGVDDMAYTLGSVGGEEKEKKGKKTTYESVSEMIRDALAQGDIALSTAGRAPQSGLLSSPAVQERFGGRLSGTGPVSGFGGIPPTQTTGDPVSSTGNADRDWIIQKESSGNPNAKNPNSSAFGLGQLIRSNREAYAKRFGFDPDTTNPQEQLKMMDAYVQERYGSYANARKFWEQHNWY